MDFDSFEERPQAHRKSKRQGRSLNFQLPAIDINKLLKQALKDKETIKAFTEYGAELKDYETMLDFLSGISLFLLIQSLENIQRLQAFEPKTADMLLELQSTINTTLGQIANILRSVGQAHRHALYEALLVREVFIFNLRHLEQANIPEETKKEVLEKLKKAMLGFQIQKPDIRQEELKDSATQLSRLLEHGNRAE